MKSARLPDLCGLVVVSGLLALAPLGHAQEYADWSESVSLPYTVPGVGGNVCRADGSTVYVAGDELAVVDLGAAAAASVSGRIVLPATAVDVEILWPYAYLACGDAGLVEVDVTDPAALRVARVFAPGTSVDRVTIVDDLVVAVDAESVVYLLGTTNTGDLAPIGRYESPDRITNAAAAEGYLAVVVAQSGYYVEFSLRILDISNPVSPAEVDTEAVGWAIAYAYNEDTDINLLAADGNRIVLTYHWVDEDPLNYMYIEGERLVTCTVDAAGRINPLDSIATSHLTSLDLDGDRIACGWGAALATLRRFDTLAATLTTRVPGKSVTLAGDRLVAVMPDELGVVDLGPGRNVQPLASVGGDLSYDGHTPQAFEWHPPFVKATSVQSSFTGRFSGTTFNSVQYWFCDARAPQALRVLDVGEVSGCSNDGNDPIYNCGGLGFARAAGPFGDRMVATVGAEGAATVRVLDLVTSAEFTILDHAYSTEWVSAGGCVWVYSYYDRTLKRHVINSADPGVATASLPLAQCGRLDSPDPGMVLNVLHDRADVYDWSTTDSPTLATSMDNTYLRSNKNVWRGRKLIITSASAAQVFDFADPAAPVLVENLALPGDSIGFVDCGDYLMIGYASGFQIARVTDEGRIDLVSPLVEFGDGARFTSGPVVGGGVAYICVENDVRAYDIHDPANPIYLGRAVAGGHSLAIVGDHLLSGRYILPREQHELATPREITIDIKRVLKPRFRGRGAGHGIIPVAVLGDADFDVATLDHASVRFGPGDAREAHTGAEGPLRHEVDLDGDGDLDLMFHFRLAETGLGPADDTATLTGTTYAGEDVIGTAGLRGTPPDAPPAGASLVLSPNPFNPRTTVGYTLAAPGPARVAVYDVRGRRVALLADGRHEAGPHAAVWQGLDDRGQSVPSGTYFVRVEADGSVLTRKALLLK
ncbi:MAG: FlgD immunoglobulin-like domain containing protein [Candidatus Krumholzibacteriia bacterium]